MGRSKALTKKYELNVSMGENELHNEKYASLREISDYLGMSYSVVSDCFQGRRGSYTNWENCRYFPTIRINKIEKTE
tara:strand:+ start:1816 stop:2046 length:231 start_codon:yes stop_codon:yes gene_type:complete